MAIVFLINPGDDFLDKKGDRPPLGLAYLSAYLKKHGHNTMILDLNHKEDEELLQEEIPIPDFICLTVSTPGYKKAIELAKILGIEYPQAKLIAGGNHVSAYPDEPLTLKTFDYVVTGTDGEEALLRIVEGKV